MKDFEEKLIQMTKPEKSDLKHQEMLEKAISGTKDKIDYIKIFTLNLIK
jgi:hypothetical protein